MRDVSTNATVTGCSAYRNRFDGIFTGTAARIEGNNIYGNGSNGIDSISTSYVARNTILVNGDDGRVLYKRNKEKYDEVEGDYWLSPLGGYRDNTWLLQWQYKF